MTHREVLGAQHKIYYECFVHFYLYSSKVQPSGSEITNFLDECSLPSLSAQDKKLPDYRGGTPSGTKMAPNGKSPDVDGLQSEVYGRYAKQLMPILLKVYNGALESGQ